MENKMRIERAQKILVLGAFGGIGGILGLILGYPIFQSISNVFYNNLLFSGCTGFTIYTSIYLGYKYFFNGKANVQILIKLQNLFDILCRRIIRALEFQSIKLILIMIIGFISGIIGGHLGGNLPYESLYQLVRLVTGNLDQLSDILSDENYLRQPVSAIVILIALKFVLKIEKIWRASFLLWIGIILNIAVFASTWHLLLLPIEGALIGVIGAIFSSSNSMQDFEKQTTLE